MTRPSSQPSTRRPDPSTRPFLGYGRQSIAPEDIDAVVEVLRSDYLTQGPTIERFEAALAEYVGARYAVERLVVVDLFPHTDHVETIVRLARRDA